MRGIRGQRSGGSMVGDRIYRWNHRLKFKECWTESIKENVLGQGTTEPGRLCRLYNCAHVSQGQKSKHVWCFIQ